MHIFRTEINSVFAKFLYSICRQSVLQVVALAYKTIPFAVCWKALKTSKTFIRMQAADIRRTFRLCTNFGEL